MKDYNIMWDYPLMPLDIWEIKNIAKLTKENFEANIVQFAYYRMCDKTVKRIEKMIKIFDAFTQYLQNKHSIIKKK